MRRTTFVGLVPLLLLLVTGEATAHAFLDHAEPRVGNKVDAAPREVTLWFTQKLEPAFSTITVTNAAGQRVDTGKTRVAVTRWRSHCAQAALEHTMSRGASSRWTHTRATVISRFRSVRNAVGQVNELARSGGRRSFGGRSRSTLCRHCRHDGNFDLPPSSGRGRLLFGKASRHRCPHANPSGRLDISQHRRGSRHDLAIIGGSVHERPLVRRVHDVGCVVDRSELDAI